MQNDRRIGIFVDGENFTIRMKNIEGVVAGHYGRVSQIFVEPDVAYWSPIYSRDDRWRNTRLGGSPLRISFYTSCVGDSDKIRGLRAKLQSMGIHHTWVSKHKKGTDPKGVDIRMATDVLTSVYDRTFDDIVIVSADKDFLPVVEAVKHRGARVFLAFPGFGILDHPRVPEPLALRKAMSIDPESEYTLAFDGVLDTFEWLLPMPVSEEERSKHAAALGATVFGEVYNNDASQPQVQRPGGAKIGRHSIRVSKEGEVTIHGTKSFGQAIPLWPLDTLEERFLAMVKSYEAA